METTIISTPARQVSLNNQSRWNAGFNPIVFLYQTEPTHYEMLSVSDPVIEVIGPFEVGMMVIIYQGDGTGARTVEVLGYSDNFIQIDSFTGFDDYDGGYVTIPNEQEDLRIITEITSGSAVVEVMHSPGPNGVTRADLSAYLRSLVTAQDASNYDLMIYNDPGLWAKYSIRYREIWDGGEGDWTVHDVDYYVTYAAMQLAEKGGGSMMHYTTFLQEPNPDKLALWLTDFWEPVFWLGMPFDVSFILNDELLGKAIVAEYTALDINRAPVTGGITGSFLIIGGGYLLTDGSSKLLIDLNDAVSGSESLTAQPGINRLLIPSGLSSTVKYLRVQLYYMDGTTKRYITKRLTIRIERPCKGDPYVYLKWINHLGAWDYYRFGHLQEYSDNVTNDVIVRRSILDWETADTSTQVTRKTATPSVDFGTDYLLPSEVDALAWLRRTVKVQMLMNENPWFWQTVIIQAGSYLTRSTRGTRQKATYTAQLADINIQQG